MANEQIAELGSMTPETEREIVTVCLRALAGDTAFLDEVNKVSRLTAALEEVREYLVKRVNFRAGPDGQLRPNQAVELVKKIDRALGWTSASSVEPVPE